MRAFASENALERKSSAESMLITATDLRGLLSKQDVPSWLADTINGLTMYTGGNWTGYDFLLNFISLKQAIDQHQWAFDADTESAFDFDSIFEYFKKTSRLPELFEEIVSLLEQIQSSGAVDSVTMVKALGKVIATMKRCRDGSYFSLNSAWEFLLSFLNNYMWGELAKLPVLGTALEALEKTIREANDEMFKLHVEVSQEMTKLVEAEVAALTSKSTFPFITYDKNGHLLSGPGNRNLPNATA